MPENRNYFGAIDDVILKEYNSSYPSEYQNEVSVLKLIILHHAVYHHIGSTAVPALLSKPIIDIAIGLDSFPLSEQTIDNLSANGYVFWRENPDLQHQFFFKNLPRTHHLHVYPIKATKLLNKIKLRDLLLLNPDLQEAYQALKIELSKKYKNDREGYTNGKTEWMNSILGSY